MAQVSMTVRMDSRLKTAFDALCQQFGMSANAAMNIFANAVVMQRKIPFEIKAAPESNSMKGIEAFQKIRKMAENGQLPEMTLDEINEEIRMAREEGSK
jgi:addiction module RelB/DinJ family antitoxin